MQSEDTIGLLNEQPQANQDLHMDDRLSIEPDGNSFYPNISRQMNKIIISAWRGAFINWNQVPTEVRELWWGLFKNTYKWDKEHDVEIYKNFKTKVGEILRNFIFTAKSKGQRPLCISTESWDQMQISFKDPKYIEKCSKAKRSRDTNSAANAGATYCGGSINAHEHKRRLAIKLGRSPNIIEIFEKTYQKKNDGGWSGPRASKAMDTFKQLQQSQNDPEASEVVKNSTLNELWVLSVGGPKGGRIFGMGTNAKYSLSKNKSSFQVSQEITSLKDEIKELQIKVQERDKKIEEMEVKLQERDEIIVELRDNVLELARRQKATDAKMEALMKAFL